MKIRSLLRWLPLVLVLGLISCTTSFDKDSQGWVLMRYFTNEEKGISGVEPVDLGENAQLVQEVFPGSLEEMIEFAKESTSFVDIPPSTGSFQGQALTWDLYSFEAEIPEIGAFTVHLDMALAEGDTKSYSVALVALPDQYEKYPQKYQSVFLHSLYVLTPLD